MKKLLRQQDSGMKLNAIKEAPAPFDHNMKK